MTAQTGTLELDLASAKFLQECVASVAVKRDTARVMADVADKIDAIVKVLGQS